MKKILYLIIVVFLITFVVGCGTSKEYNYKLLLKESSWSGWVNDGGIDSKIVTNEFDVVLNKEYSAINSDLTFKVIKINKDSIVIKTNQALSDNEEGIDLKSDKTEFKIYLDKETKLETPTMDAGDIYYFTLSK